VLFRDKGWGSAPAAGTQRGRLFEFPPAELSVRRAERFECAFRVPANYDQLALRSAGEAVVVAEVSVGVASIAIIAAKAANEPSVADAATEPSVSEAARSLDC
jgi:hypothetical protein